MAAMKNILVPTDFSEYSDKALSEAVELAKQHNANIHLLHVIEYVHHRKANIGVSADIASELETKRVTESQERMHKQIGLLEEDKRSQIMTSIKSGPASDVILSEQKRKDIDMIMIGSHGVKGFFSGLVGGVTYRVVKNAPCSVMVVRA